MLPASVSLLNAGAGNNYAIIMLVLSILNMKIEYVNTKNTALGKVIKRYATIPTNITSLKEVEIIMCVSTFFYDLCVLSLFLLLLFAVNQLLH